MKISIPSGKIKKMFNLSFMKIRRYKNEMVKNHLLITNLIQN